MKDEFTNWKIGITCPLYREQPVDALRERLLVRALSRKRDMYAAGGGDVSAGTELSHLSALLLRKDRKRPGRMSIERNVSSSPSSRNLS